MSLNSVVFLGYYGYMNTGDDVFCVVGSWGARKYWRSRRVGFWAKIDELPYITTSVEALKFKRFCMDGNKLFSLFQSLHGANRLFRKVLIFGGGSTLVSGPKKGTIAWFSDKLTRLNQMRMGAIGVSLGPFNTIKDYYSCRRFLSSFSFIVLRDRRSFEIAKGMGLSQKARLGFDLAGLLPQIYGQPLKNRNSTIPILGISLRHYERHFYGSLHHENVRELNVLEMLNYITRIIPVRMRFFIFNDNPIKGDKELTHKIINNMENRSEIHVVPYDRNPGNTWKRIAECDAFFSIRLHGGVFAAVAGVPFVLVEYHRKCSDFLDDLGIDNNFRIGDFELSPREVADYLVSLLTRKNKQQKYLSEDLVKRAEANFIEPLKIQ